MAYRFFVNDAISFDRSLKVAIGFGENEHPSFREQFSQPGTSLQFSSTCYWYQAEPHATFPPMAQAADRVPAPEKLFWPDEPALPDVDALRARGVRFHMLCGLEENEVVLAEPGFGAAVQQGYCWTGWPPPVYHCRADDNEVRIELHVPEKSAGKLRIFVIDPDEFQGGRKQEVFVGKRSLGVAKDFRKGRWLETPVTQQMTAGGKLLIRAVNLNKPSNAVISIIEWLPNDK